MLPICKYKAKNFEEIFEEMKNFLAKSSFLCYTIIISYSKKDGKGNEF